MEVSALVAHVPYVMAIAGLVYLHWLRTREESSRDRIVRHFADDVMEAYRNSNDNFLALLCVAAGAATDLERMGHKAEAERLRERIMGAYAGLPKK